jgi:hypothetical protein
MYKIIWSEPEGAIKNLLLRLSAATQQQQKQLQTTNFLQTFEVFKTSKV